MIIYFNGRLISASEFVVSPLDHGFLYGHGLFETMRAYNGRVFRLDEHLNRLKYAADYLRWPTLPTHAELKAAITSVLNKNQLTDASVRLTVSRGSGAPRPDPGSCGEPSITLFALPLPAPLPPDGWSIATVTLQRNLSSPLVRIKSANYLDNILAKNEAKAQGAQEALMLNTAGFVAEGSMSNLFFVTAGRLITPDENSGILPGITRNCIIELAQASGMPVEARPVKPEELTEADEIFLTSSVMEVIPVKMLDGCPIGSQQIVPGCFTARLKELYWERTKKE
ncbi:Branched-chain-amino-acid aminotransferase [Sporomusa silvacetica DSM 10669]|uniref:Branched-chain-amino-acid aminotransferase n=1 Tax=Sporomusa silvacetica DSM 10669 TaxID=1123289 RepID=A0ABZ3IKB1_9FIRM|nr:aminotransferase class IV [Sporomusa silvacetica]OZC18798.1 branched-chain-amino-acid aminotransferase [Sporomusa silvacetica DSM 10669]